MAYCCPNCGSRDIVCTEKGYSIGKGLLGIVTFGLVGGLAGLHGSKRLVWRCPRCNGCFREPAIAADTMAMPTEAPAAPVASMPTAEQLLKEAHAKEAAAKLKANRTPPVVKQRIVCACGAYNSIYNKTCFSCGAAISLATSVKVPAMPAKVVVCNCGTKNALTHKHCIACGVWLDYGQLEQQDGQQTYNQQPCPHCGADTPAKSRKVQYCAHCGEPL